MPHSLGPISVTRKSGTESFSHKGQSLDLNLLSFWQWFASDLLNNTTRGMLAEYLVSRALSDTRETRIQWDVYDVKMENGIRVEVKSSAYIQSWYQEKPSAISFGINSTQAWEPDTNTFSKERKRQADVYVFCLLDHKDQETVDPLNLDQWRFFVISTEELDEKLGDQKRVSLNPLIQIGAEEVEYSELSDAVENAVHDSAD